MLKRIRFYILGSSITLAVLTFLYWRLTVPLDALLIIRLTQTYALLALLFLYLTLLISPVTEIWPRLPGKLLVIRARRSLGVSVFLFALLHALFAFFGLLGGFAGLPYLGSTYLTAVILGFIDILVLTTMAATSFDWLVNRLGPRWKLIHRFIYLVGFFILIHASLIGTHFASLSIGLGQTTMWLVAGLLILEVWRIDRWLRRRYNWSADYSFVGLLFVSVIIATIMILTRPNGTAINIHAQHLALARQAQPSGVGQNLPSIPGLIGDRTKRFSVSFDQPDTPIVNHDILLHFSVNDANSGNLILLFATLYDKVAHLVIVDDQLNYYSHIHPTLDATGFAIATQLPHDGRYHLYLNFQPLGAIEQQFASTVNVGNSVSTVATHTPDTDLTKTFGHYDVTVQFPQPLKASLLSIGQQQISFSFRDHQTQQPISNLYPYLAAFGHLVMINQANYEYLHVHPTNLKPPKATDTSGPTVNFLPLGLYGPIKPGMYRLFAQFNPAGQLMVADYTVKVEP